MTDEKRKDWTILPPNFIGTQPDGDSVLYQLYRVRCPEGHERDLTLAEQADRELPCPRCGGTTYPIDWNKRDDDNE